MNQGRLCLDAMLEFNDVGGCNVPFVMIMLGLVRLI